MKPRTAAEEYLARRRFEPEYRSAYEATARRLAMFDDVVRSLEARREELGLTKAELARRADMTPAVVRRLFSQQHKNPTLTSLAALADALDLSLSLVPIGDSLRLPTTPVPRARNVPASSASPSRAVGTRRRTA
jgi:ribosome-binding protein aMBF1 (putative translation factor)